MSLFTLPVSDVLCKYIYYQVVVDGGVHLGGCGGRGGCQEFFGGLLGRGGGRNK